MIVSLSRVYVARTGTPKVERVDQRIFSLTYFHHCMSCSFCQDSCCQYGCTVDAEQVQRWHAEAELIESELGLPASSWVTGEWGEDVDYPGGRWTRTQVRDTPKGPLCVFADPVGRGCRLHSLALRLGRDVHELKPMICTMFPVLFAEGTLVVPEEIDDPSLICLGPGLTLYRSARNDLEYFFGSELVAELDRLEAQSLAEASPQGALQLPIVSG
jgi:Fe-S-cluster containining protein